MLSSTFISETIPADLWDRYSQVEVDMILAFARRVRDSDFTDQLAVDRLKTMGVLREDLERIVAQAWPGTQKEVADAFDKAGAKSLASSERIFQAAAAAGLLLAAPAIAESLYLRNIVASGYGETVRRLERINRTAVNTTLDDFSGIVSRVAFGDLTLEAGIQQAVNEFASRGVVGHIGINGRHHELAPYVRMIIRTGVTRTTAELGFARMDEYGCDLLVVSAHAGARPRCFPFQGRVYSRSGTHSTFQPWSSTSYGEIAGLLGINCGHFVDPFIEGLDSVPTKEERDPAKYQLGKSNAEVYRESQAQRYNERKIREWKHRVTAMEEAGIDSGRARNKVAEWQAEQRRFIEETGRTRRYNRERIVSASASPQTDSYILPPPNSIEEAIQQAAGLGVGAEYRALSLETARLVNASLYEAKEKGFTVPARVFLDSATFINARNAPAAFSYQQNALKLNPFYDYSLLAEASIRNYTRKGWSTPNPQQVFRHEIGHAVAYAGNKVKYLRLREAVQTGPLPLAPSVRQMVANEVSIYATYSPLEFVAEVFAGLMDGRTYSDKIMRMYKAYGGVWK